MKQPRTADFDPSAKEWALKSSMADFPAIEQPQQAGPTDTRPQTASPVLPDTDMSSLVPGRRKIKQRHSYDVYEDQVEAIKKLALEDRMRGGAKSESAMVREALDDFIAKMRAKAGGK